MAAAVALVPVVLQFVLIHGFGGGAWNWYKLRCMMEASGYKATPLDLKGAGTDLTDPKTIRSFDEYNEPLTRFMENLLDHEQVVLVGHSVGGLSITHAIHMFPKKITMAIYVGATMLKFGFQTKEDRRIGMPGGGSRDDEAYYESGYGAAEGKQSTPPAVLTKHSRTQILKYSTMPPEDVILDEMLFRAGPWDALARAGFNKSGGSQELEQVKRVYIRTAYDQILKPEQQDEMIKRWPPAQVYTLDCDHHALTAAPFPLFAVFINATAAIHT